MTKPDAPQHDAPQNDPLDDTTFDSTTDDTTDETRAIGVEERTSTDVFGPPVDREWPPVLPERPSGPHAPAIVLGLVCVVVAGIIFAQELGDLSVDWGDVGPVGIVVTGAVLVLFGLVGLLTSRRNSKTS